jgi:TolA-binding protein
MVKQDQSQDAMAVFKELLQKYPDDPLSLEGQFSLGSLYFEAQDYKKALEAYTQIYQTYPTHRLAPHCLFNSAICEKQLKHPDKTLEDFQKLMKDYPTDELALEAGINAGILLEAQGRKDEALTAYATSMKSQNPKLAAESSFYHADLLKNMGKYPESIGEFNSIIDKYPEQDQWSVTAFARIAECYENQKQFQKAMETYQRILAFTKVKEYRLAAQKRMKALKIIMASGHTKGKKKSAPPALTPGVKP